jgi:hypothetical protein
LIIPPDEIIRDTCCWKRCKEASSIILLGIGLCDDHFSQYITKHESSTLETLYTFLNPKVKKLIKEFEKEDY